jgi:hypothetical protein
MYRVALLLLAFALQGGPQSVGVVTGVVRGANGMPAPGIRVYAIGVQEGVEFNASAPLEGLTQTDASGRYRIEVAPGRYYIATGSVNAPTFYPGTTNVTGARVLTIASGRLVEAIDFSSYVVPSQTGIASILRPGTGVLSGTVRFPDGIPATGIFVGAVPALTPSGPLASMPAVVSNGARLAGVVRIAPIDGNGRYVLQNLPADTYYVAAGFGESPTFYPGVPDILAATTIPVTASTKLATLDFTVARPPAGITVSGRVTAAGNVPARGASVLINSTLPITSTYGLPSSRQRRSVPVRDDGRFELTNVLPGFYTVLASSPDFRTETMTISVGAESISDLNLSIRAAGISGRIVGNDGKAIPDASLFGEAVLATASNPSIVISTLLPIARDGSFSRLLPAEEYRFFLRQLPEEYSIDSIKAGSVDLMKDTLKFTGTEPAIVEVRVAKRVRSSDAMGVSVTGRTLDAVTGTPPVAERITLCCWEGGPAQRFSAPLKPDGSFAFAGIPPGTYSIGLQTREGLPVLFIVERNVVVEAQTISGLDFSSTPGFGELLANIVVESGAASLPAPAAMSIVFTGSNGRLRVTAMRLPTGQYHATLPAGDRYTVSVLNPPEGFAVKSILGSTEVRQQNIPGFGVPAPLVPLVITLAPASK